MLIIIMLFLNEMGNSNRHWQKKTRVHVRVTRPFW